MSTALLLLSLWERQQGRFPAQSSQSTESAIEYDGQKYQGMNNLVNALKDNSDLIEKLKKEVIFLATRKSD